MSVIDSGASLHMRGLSSLTLKIQTANGMVTSDTHAKLYVRELGTFPWVHVVENSPSVLSLLRTQMEHIIRRTSSEKSAK